MSVIVKGMELPDSCHVCVAGYGGCCFVAPPDSDGVCPDRGRADFCPLIPIQPHGRLIDADNLLTNKSINIIGKGMIFGGQYVFSESEIVNAPTIIPEEPCNDLAKPNNDAEEGE